MSNFSDVRELLMHNKQLHLRAAVHYKQLAEETGNARAAMLLQTLCKHEAQLVEELKRYMEEAPEKVLNTYIQYDRRENSNDLFNCDFDPVSCSESDVEKLANKVDEYFCQLYEDMARSADVQPVSEMFDNLYDHLVEEKKRLSTDIYSLADI
ncbi:hypothetical protein [Lacimicrobium alkaliphilum]|uniref:Uncharacterized protein n=1 Tax=Lacimicrobium alkaliphilum TaxID=1526571 RepID=A0A0U2ZDC3_9ALTE|nr:hypothetical protein [Lacimicrobium alkaliphilum]ALS97111.1 hypothetical protein AT746_01660 [Lacimicrobium alkaliphilum]